MIFFLNLLDIVALQCYVSFCYTAKWIRYICTYSPSFLILLRRFLGSPFPINEIVINLFQLFIDNINDERCYFSVWSSLQMFNTMMMLGTWIFFLLLAFLVSLWTQQQSKLGSQVLWVISIEPAQWWLPSPTDSTHAQPCSRPLCFKPRSHCHLLFTRLPCPPNALVWACLGSSLSVQDC